MARARVCGESIVRRRAGIQVRGAGAAEVETLRAEAWLSRREAEPRLMQRVAKAKLRRRLIEVEPRRGGEWLGSRLGFLRGEEERGNWEISKSV